MNKIVGAVDFTRKEHIQPIVFIRTKYAGPKYGPHKGSQKPKPKPPKVIAAAVEDYLKKQKPAIDKLWNGIPGCLCLAQTKNPNETTDYIELLILKDLEAYNLYADYVKWGTKNRDLFDERTSDLMSVPCGQHYIFGGWDEYVEKHHLGVRFRKSDYGFIRQETAGFEGTPIIFTFDRCVKPGTENEFRQAASDLYEHDRLNMPNLLASTCCKDHTGKYDEPEELNRFHFLYMWANIQAFEEWAKTCGNPDNVMNAKFRGFFDNNKPCKGKVFAKEHKNMQKMLGNVDKAWAKILCLDLAPIGKIDFNRGKEKIVIQPKMITDQIETNIEPELKVE